MKKSRRINYQDISFFLYFVLSFILTITHEPFKNEAQAWLIVRDLDLSGIINIMWYEGTPALWHLILYPFVKLGFPYLTMQIIHWVFAVAIAWLVIYKSTFPNYLRVLLCFSYYFLYEYCAMARNYNITILLMFTLATIWKRKHELPLLFCVLTILLINTNLIVWGFGIAITLLYIYDHYKSNNKFNFTVWISIFILLAGFTLVLLQILPRASFDQHSVVSFKFWDVKFPQMLFRAPANAMISNGGDTQSMIIPIFFFLAACMVLLWLLKKIRVFSAALLSCLWCIYMFIFIYFGSSRHHGFLLIIFAFFLWILPYYDQSKKHPKFIPSYLTSQSLRDGIRLIVSLCLITTIFRTMAIFPKEVKYQFSGSKEIAQYIKKSDLIDYIWVGFQAEKCEAILPYFPERKFWYAGIQDWGSYIIWNQEFKLNHGISDPQIIKRINDRFPDKQNILLVMSRPLKDPVNSGYKLIYQNRKRIFWIHDETFYLYTPLTDNQLSPEV